MQEILKLQISCFWAGVSGFVSFSVEQSPILSVDPKRVKIIFQPDREIEPYCFSGWRIVVFQGNMMLHRGRGKRTIIFYDVGKFFWGAEKLIINPYYIKGISNGRRIFQMNL
ncbi:MAG: hypothetical protein PHY72_02565 [Candidatus Pacebacteria bacterium]|nr:hypothetical protein [Candidatus Paceibacterota bacterium]